MEEMLKQILNKLDATTEKLDATTKEIAQIRKDMATKEDITLISEDIARLESKLDSYHSENILADDKLLEAIRTTNDRLNFQREKIADFEEDLYLVKQKVNSLSGN